MAVRDAMDGTFPWDVELPESARRPMGAPKPKATLVYGDGPERLPIALALGRDLVARRDEVDSRDEAQLLDAVLAREGELAWDWLVKALNRRDLSAEEARQRLLREGYGTRAVESAVERARESRYIDDLRYADTFARQRKAAGWGRGRIERELARRGIPVAEMEGWSEEHFDRDGERERARRLLARRSVPESRPFEKLARYLVNRGFDYAVAKEAARERIDGDEGFD